MDTRNKAFIDDVLFDHAVNLNQDQAYWFKIRGNNINRFIDCATPLLGMALRIKTLTERPDVDALRNQCIDEIKLIEVELTESGVEYATILAYRYILCSFVDEAVMATSWGSDSSWASYSLLTRFHSETWGGEKVFIILSRLEKEIERYFDMLEFIFLCLCLGFEGRYKVMERGKVEYEKVVTQLYELLNRYKNKDPEALTTPYKYVASSAYRISKQITVARLLLYIFIVVIVVYAFYRWNLNAKADAIVDQLREILKK